MTHDEKGQSFEIHQPFVADLNQCHVDAFNPRKLQ
jgi:hypothetical protein